LIAQLLCWAYLILTVLWIFAAFSVLIQTPAQLQIGLILVVTSVPVVIVGLGAAVLGC